MWRTRDHEPSRSTSPVLVGSCGGRIMSCCFRMILAKAQPGSHGVSAYEAVGSGHEEVRPASESGIFKPFVVSR